MSGLKEYAIALARIVLGMIILIEVIIALVFLHYTTMIGGFYGDKIDTAYDDSYDNGYTQTYDVVYQKAYSEAHDKGYEKGYEIGLETGSNKGLIRITALRNPTHKEMREFLANDETDSCSFAAGEYVCSDFAAQVNNNAETGGIRAAYVRIRSKEWGHAVVAFETVDRGLIFIEPQSDKQIELVIGKPFPWYLVGAVSPLTSYDPITEIEIIW
ncbi:hypothetical protein ACFLVO_03980 [Chloroflexota bacterium]